MPNKKDSPRTAQVVKDRGGPAKAARDETDRDADFIASLEKGFRVIRAFDGDHAAMTLTEVADRAGLTRAAARRFLITLERLGYAHADGKRFSLTARLLELGFAYLRSARLPELLTPRLQRVTEALHESSSASVLEGHDVVYIARVSTSRIMRVELGVGARLPAVATSMGRVLLAFLPEAEREDLLRSAELVAHTARTVTSRAKLRAILREVRESGHCLVDQELEEGLRSIAVPVVEANGRVRAAINVSAQANRATLETMRKTFLPTLLKAAADLRVLSPV